MDWLDMSSWAPEISRQIITKQCLKENIVTTSASVGKLDLYSISQSEASRIEVFRYSKMEDGPKHFCRSITTLNGEHKALPF